MDALKGIGHACGHNLIAVSSVVGALATAKVMQDESLDGKVVLFGTPAEGRPGPAHSASNHVEQCMQLGRSDRRSFLQPRSQVRGKWPHCSAYCVGLLVEHAQELCGAVCNDSVGLECWNTNTDQHRGWRRQDSIAGSRRVQRSQRQLLPHRPPRHYC